MFSLGLSRRQDGGDKAGVNTLTLHLPVKPSFKENLMFDGRVLVLTFSPSQMVYS